MSLQMFIKIYAIVEMIATIESEIQNGRRNWDQTTLVSRLKR